MKTIYKYELKNLSSENILHMPEGAEIISVGNQREKLVVWAAVEHGCKKVGPRTIKCVLTGQATGLSGYIFLGTVLFDNGNFVVHCFEYPE
jgi:hypothetical protein